MSNTVPKKLDGTKKPNASQPKRPNEQGSFSVEAHIRIFDPKTREVYLEGRA